MKLKKVLALTLAMGVLLSTGSFTTTSAKTAPARYVKSMKISETTVNLESGENSTIKATVNTKGNASKKVKVIIAKDDRKVINVKVGKPNKKGVSKIKLTAGEVTERKTVNVHVTTVSDNKRGKVLTKNVKVVVAPKVTAPVQSVDTNTTTNDTQNNVDTEIVIPEKALHEYKYDDQNILGLKEIHVYENYLMFVFNSDSDAKWMKNEKSISCSINNVNVTSSDYAWTKNGENIYIACKCEQAENVTRVYFGEFTIENFAAPRLQYERIGGEVLDIRSQEYNSNTNQWSEAKSNDVFFPMTNAE